MLGDVRDHGKTLVQRVLCLVLLCLVAGSVYGFSATLYSFSLPENGDVGAIEFAVLLDDSAINFGLIVLPPDDPAIVSFSSGTPIDPLGSGIGIDIGDANTLVGIAFFGLAGEIVAFTSSFPNDFFVFDRTPAEFGSFPSSSGLLASDLDLDTATPAATLTVTDVADIPEPGTWMLLSFGLLGLAAARRMRFLR